MKAYLPVCVNEQNQAAPSEFEGDDLPGNSESFSTGFQVTGDAG